ncbi:hypothetical protein COCC4DRAFT_31459, partial [Bipolaris maydis ATCC 48331]
MRKNTRPGLLESNSGMMYWEPALVFYLSVRCARVMVIVGIHRRYVSKTADVPDDPHTVVIGVGP